MKVRFQVNERGELQDRDGRVLGKVTALTLEVSDRGAMGGGVEVGEQQGKKNTSPPTPETLGIWRYYQDVFGAHRQELNPQRRRDIERALRVRDVETIKRAIDGLHRSPHHQGHNETGTRYTDIRYALRGNSQRGESPEERIDRMASLAGGTTAVRSAQAQAHIDEAKRSVMAGWHRDPQRPAPTADALERAAEAIERLREEFGVAVRFGDDGRPTFVEGLR
jgi:hypothetical protein